MKLKKRIKFIFNGFFVLIRLVVYKLLRFFALINCSVVDTQASLLIVRIDAIGDYLLFRNFLYFIKSSDRFKNMRITLIGNVAWKSLATVYDSETIEQFIWIDRKKFRHNVAYHLRILRFIASKKYDVVINPCFTREFFMADHLVRVIKARCKIGTTGDGVFQPYWQHRISDKYYSQLIDLDAKEIMFEFNRNKLFCERLLNKTIDIEKNTLPVNHGIDAMLLPDKYIVLFTGASQLAHRWSVNKFIKIAEYLHINHHIPVVIAGLSSEISQNDIQQINVQPNIINLIDKTALLDLAVLLKKACLVVSNETSIPHFCAALDVPVIVLSNGNRLKRFTNYPVELHKYYRVIYPETIENSELTELELYNKFAQCPNLNIDLISTKQVIQALESFMMVLPNHDG